MREKTNFNIITIRFDGDFSVIWEEFKRLSERDEQLNEIRFLKVEQKAKPIPVRIRNLIANYVKNKRAASNEN